LQNAVKDIVYVYMRLLLLTYHALYTEGYGHHIQNGYMIVVDLPMLKVQRQNPPVGSKPLRATRARDEATQGVASNWRIRSPIEGTRHPPASYLSTDREVSFRPLMWASIEPSKFSTRITQERCVK
jgi:hypothetical protein